jgi:antitoxin CcdA
MSEIVTVRVKKSLKEKTRKYKINVSKIVRQALEDEVKKQEEAELFRAVSELKVLLQKIPDEEIVKDIRESRDQR